MKRHGLMLVGCLIALPGMASAGSCVSETVQALLGSSCNIGDLQFTFGSTYLLNSSDSTNSGEYAASAVTFTPGTGGFTLSGSFSTSSSSFAYGEGSLSYSLSVTDGTLSGITTSISSPSLSVQPQSGSTSTAEIQAANVVQGSIEAVTQPYLSQSYGNSQVNGNAGNGGNASVSPSVSVTSGSANIATEVNYHSGDAGLATASFTSASFGFTVTPTATPEPSGWLLLATIGALTILPIRRLRRRE